MTTSDGDHVVDIAIVGAGPAGLAAAVAAAERLAAAATPRVALIDGADQPGGQYWRHRAEDFVPLSGAVPAGQHDWHRFVDLRHRAARESAKLVFLGGHQVFSIGTDRGGFAITAKPGEQPPVRIRAGRLILCPGAYDRQLPVPGWDLPGVMAAGGVQALLKGHGVVAGRRVVVAGTGPFLLPVAAGLAQAGAQVVEVCEANRVTSWSSGAGRAAGVPSKIAEGAAYAAMLLRHRIPYRTAAAVTRIDGTDRVCGVVVDRLDAAGVPAGRPRTLTGIDLVALGWGFTPQPELLIMCELENRVDADESLAAVVDEQQQGSVPGIYVAGEATGVGGALKALCEGEIAGAAAAGVPLPHNARVRRTLRRHRRFAQALHRAYPIPKGWTGWLTPTTLMCRCEEVTWKQTRDAWRLLDADDPRTVKSLTRTGMGWCQGRMCGFGVTQAMTSERGRPPGVDDLTGLGRRSLAAPVTLADLSRLDQQDPQPKPDETNQE